MEKIWEVLPKIPDDFKERFPEIHPVILQLLYNRGLWTQEQIDEFLLPDYSQDIHSPFLFQDMEKAVDLIYQAIEQKQKVVICGDYDADGITATAVIFSVLEKLGAENVSTYIPRRDVDGYGLNETLIKNLIKQKTDLIITCDCGISNVKEIGLAEEAGIKVIITDHHCQPSELPKAAAMINPQLARENYPFKSLAGVGVAFKLAQALLADERCQVENKEATEKWLLDLVAIGTVADCMPLLGENRTLVKYGLLVLNKTANQGLRSLVVKSGLVLGKIDAANITYHFGPRLNAAARIKHADEALKLVLGKDKDEADKLADDLNDFNRKRQNLVERVFSEIVKVIGPEPKDKIIIVAGTDWPKGVIGLSASKIVEQYYRPVLVFTRENEEMAASGRSTSSFNLYQALSQLENFFLRFGGHAAALGLTLKSPDVFEDFKQKLLAIGEKKIKNEDLIPRMTIDTLVNLEEVDWPLYEELAKFEPFGKSNPQPNFLVKNVRLNEIVPVGQNGQHFRLIVGPGRKMIYFGANHKVSGLKPGGEIDVVFQLGVNQWNGQQELQMKVIDLKKSEK